MRVALISDLHGNEVALRAVLSQIKRVGVDQIVCLGDTATLGPDPKRVLDTLREVGCACILGNHDEFLLDAELIHRYTEAPIIRDAVNWCRDQLSSDDFDFVRTFLTRLVIPLENGSKLLLFHGSPRSHMEDILATTPSSELDGMLDGHTATVMAGGHTHVQMLRQHHGMLLVNPGSVGMPFRDYVNGRQPVILPHAEFAIVTSERTGVEVSLQRVAVDKAALRDAVRPSTAPLRDMLLAQYA